MTPIRELTDKELDAVAAGLTIEPARREVLLPRPAEEAVPYESVPPRRIIEV